MYMNYASKQDKSEPLQQIMDGGRALLIAAGKLSNLPGFYQDLASTHHIIAVDGGLRLLRDLNLPPTIVVGDLDSATEAELEWASENNAEIVLITTQSESDLDKALNLCHQRELNDVIVDGIEGGRHDHFIGVLAALADGHPSLNICANLPSTKLSRFVVGFSGKIKINGTFSVFSFGKSKVTLSGSEWELNNDNVTFSTSGLSNLCNEEAELTIHSGDPVFLLINF